MTTAQQIAGGIVLVAAFLAALVYLGRGVALLVRGIRAVIRLVEHELDYNDGGSMKDDVTGIAVSVGRLSRHVDELDGRLTAHLKGRNK